MKNNIFIFLFCLTQLTGCSVIVVNSEKTEQPIIENKTKQIEIQNNKQPCVVDDLINQVTPKIPLDKISNSNTNYREKTTILIDYIAELRTYVQQIKKDFRSYQIKVEEKCHK